MRHAFTYLAGTLLVMSVAACRSDKPGAADQPPMSQPPLLTASSTAESTSVSWSPPTRTPRYQYTDEPFVTAPAPTSTTMPTPSAALPPILASHADTAPPPGAVAQLGLGYVSPQSLSPDGRYLVIQVDEETYVYDAPTLARRWQAKSGGWVTWLFPQRQVAIGPVVYDIDTGGVVRSLTVPGDHVAWSPDGMLAATYSDRGEMIVWDMATTQPLWRAPLPDMIYKWSEVGWQLKMRFSPASDRIAVTYQWSTSHEQEPDNHLFLRDARTGQLLSILSGSDFFYGEPDWSPDGSRIAVQPGDQALGPLGASFGVWDITSSEQVASIPATLDLDWSPDGKMFATAGIAGVQLWSAETGARIAELAPNQTMSTVALSQDGSRLAATVAYADTYGYTGGAVEIWDISTQERIALLPQTAPVIGFSSEALIAGVETLNSVAVWPLNEREPLGPVIYLRGMPSVSGLAWSPDGQELAASYNDYHPAHSLPDQTLFGIWNVAERQLRTMEADTNPHTSLFDVSWSPDGTIIASIGLTDGETVLRDARTGQATDLIDTGGTRALFSPDSSLLATARAGSDGVEVWDVATRERLGWYGTGEGWFQAVDWSPDSKLLAIALDISSLAGTVIVVEPREHREAYRLDIENPALGTAWSPDGTRLAIASDTDITVWPISPTGPTGDPLTLYSDHGPDVITAIDWSPDGSQIAAAFGSPVAWRFSEGGEVPGDGLVMVWDAYTGERRYRFEGHQTQVQAVAFSPDGLRLASGAVDGTILIWDVTP